MVVEKYFFVLIFYNKEGGTKTFPFCPVFFFCEVTKLLVEKEALFKNLVSFLVCFDYNSSTKIMNMWNFGGMK